MELEARVAAFAQLGGQLQDFLHNCEASGKLPTEKYAELANAMTQAYQSNNWFTIDNQMLALKGIARMLQVDELMAWAAAYVQQQPAAARTVAVIMAGNIPAVGFHDFLSVLMSGHRFLGKLSTDDRQLLPALARMLCETEPRFTNHIVFTDGQIRHYDAVIATGSDNTSRYFDYYFSHVPHIIRRNRNSLGIVRGSETTASLSGLADDIFSYFGLGCRSVSHLLLPEAYQPELLFEAFEPWRHLRDHHKYFNNYEYHKAICLINKLPHHDNGFVLLIPDEKLSGGVSVVHYSHYKHKDDIDNLIAANRDKIQCVVSEGGWYEGSFAFGQAQLPSVWDYADGTDTMQFLAGLAG
ncbi:MAG: acyl-CoA reductase [Bacteroidetes bacterium]|nr:acyl-CoA reductase [Bacteroidota bacterium]